MTLPTLIKGFHYFMFQRRYIILDFSIAIGVFYWGVALLDPRTDIFTIYRITLGQFDIVAPEWIWGLLMTITAVLFMIAGWQKLLTLYRISLFAIVVFRIFDFMLIGMQTKFISPGMGDFLAWVLLSAWQYIHAERNLLAPYTRGLFENWTSNEPTTTAPSKRTK